MLHEATDRDLLGRLSAKVGSLQISKWILDEAGSRCSGRQVESLAFEMAARYLGGEPLQYIFGHWSFRSLELNCDRRGLIPRPETELLVDLAISAIAANPAIVNVLEIGTGTGAIALALASEISGLKILAIDNSPEALKLARENLAAQASLKSEVEIVYSDLFSSLEDYGPFDLIVSNPPYIANSAKLDPRVAGYEPHQALFAGEDGLSVIRRIIEGSPSVLSGGSAQHVLIEIGETHGRKVVELALRNGYSQVCIRKDLAGRDRFACLVL
ncbi:MAG: peptide chain release factor N(5)-glutamine methyltransferase [Actinomycetota bacterium]|nr:MAG: peptide chain release factor N(5)-glutamine methyltransferase [Actinomycetota bacterium]